MNLEDLIAHTLWDVRISGRMPPWPTPEDEYPDRVAAQAVLEVFAQRGFVVVACPPGGRVVVSRESKPCPECEGEGSMWAVDEFCGVVEQCTPCGGSGVVEATTTYGLEDVELYWNGIEQAIDVYGDGRPEQYEASMPLFRLVALPEETPQ